MIQNCNLQTTNHNVVVFSLLSVIKNIFTYNKQITIIVCLEKITIAQLDQDSDDIIPEIKHLLL